MQVEIFMNPHMTFKDDKGRTINSKDDLNKFMRTHKIVKTVELIIPPHSLPKSNLQGGGVQIYGAQIIVMVYYEYEKPEGTLES